jgi:Ca-activated chloride channel family protein
VVSLLAPAHVEETGDAVPRTVTFLVDRSGSMGQGPMQAAIRAVRGALRALGPDDLLNVVAFDDTLEALARRPVPFSDATLRAADAFVAQLAARGGTQARMAIGAALDDVQAHASQVAIAEAAPAADSRHRLRLVVFMTDGDVAGAEDVLRAAKAKLADTRIHVVGIGDAVNHAMLAELARLGGGTYTPVSTGEDLERALVRLKNAMGAPVWTGVRVALESAGDRRTPEGLEPPGPLDLFAEEPLLVAFRGRVGRGDRLVVTAQGARGDDVTLRVPLDVDVPEAQSKLAPTAWALLKNRRLSYRFDPADDPALDALGTAFGLVNRATALVGVDPARRDVVVEASAPVVLPLPRDVAEMSAAGLAGAVAGGVNCNKVVPMRARMMAFMPGGFGGRPAMAMPSAPAPALAPASGLGTGAAPPMGEEAMLRALFLRQDAAGLFDGEIGVTLAAVAALASRGHTAREGLFRAELRRTLRALRALLAQGSADDRVRAALGVALVTLGHVPELPAAIAVHIEGASTADLPGLRAAVRAALTAAPPSRGGADILAAFGM